MQSYLCPIAWSSNFKVHQWHIWGAENEVHRLQLLKDGQLHKPGWYDRHFFCQRSDPHKGIGKDRHQDIFNDAFEHAGLIK